MLRKLFLRAFMKLEEKLSLRKRAAKKAASEENLLKNKTEKLFMKRIRKREGVELQRKLHMKGI